MFLNIHITKNLRILFNLEKRLLIDEKNLTFNSIKSKLSFLPIKNGGKNFDEKSYDLNQNLPKIAIIVPYRNRDLNLKLFLEYMHQFLSDQNILYGIYIIEPIENLVFNRGLLLNIGFKEALKETDWDCFIFHDIDLLPENDHNYYKCDTVTPKQMAISISVYNYV
jgi:hypothetical protein